ncbi:uncharacterized protein F5891DRAFT_1129282 [Suillus fuscotomentosus]|uniref:Uncharacterized protein n=1 Tax=Suillus fuscotomentosus TaxID=1912939 RepID=A0AAD4HJH6_9AGAM|nr:uncharacterized protein F5891DRAFT_1129282 [Suillus fuscotomentosus]KAG1898812.1 hypothetical protein F5891DRAFT_1129282 [Suillus fuscotomentosus]
MKSIAGLASENKPLPAVPHPDFNKFKTEYHPNSGRPTVIENFSVYGCGDAVPPFVDNSPWLPFSCCADFEFAELAHRAALSKEHMDKFLWLIWNAVDGHAKLTFKTHGDVLRAWDKASMQMTPFEKHVISVDYQKGTLDFDVYSQPLWDWAMDLLNEPILAPHFEWNAQQLYKHDGTRYEQFIHEPWTADHWWRIQSSLPNNGVPFSFILYADKTHLSSSGNVKGYPVISRCANLPVPEDAEEDHKLSYTNLKHVVWHEAFLKFLEVIILYSKTGFAHKCFNDVERWLYALILLLLADYEEQCVMALIQGTGSLCPCPICLVPSSKLCDHTVTYPTQKVEDAQIRIKLYEENRAAGEAALKEQVENSNPHETISQDPLHAFQGGLYGYHIHEEAKSLAELLGRSALKQIDEQFDAFPRWRGLNHFHRVTNISFSDGNKFQDISKQFLFAAHNVLTKQKSKAGYMLLRCIASYLKVDMYILLDTQMESTLAAGEAAYEYCKVAGDSTKNWNFPKVHAGKHIFHDIREKGAARNFSTRPNEKQHGPLKRMYLRQTNHKDIANQLLQLDHRTLVSELIGGRIAQLDEQRLRELRDADNNNNDPDDNDDPEDATHIGVSFQGHIYLGSPQCPTSFADVEEANSSSRAFDQFWKKFSTFINEFLPAHDIPLPDGKMWLRPAAQDKLQEYRYLKVHYESVVDWKLAMDYLRCNLNFHGHERRDCTLIHTHDKDGNSKNIFAQILFMFKYSVGDQCLDLALVLPMDAPIGPRPAVDQDLQFTRLRVWPPASSEFLSIHSIIRGALVVPDYANPL